LGVGVTGLLTVAMYVSDPAIGLWFAGLTVSLYAVAGILISGNQGAVNWIAIHHAYETLYEEAIGPPL